MAKIEVASADIINTTTMVGEGASAVVKVTGKVGADVLETLLGKEISKAIEQKVGVKATENVSTQGGFS